MNVRKVARRYCGRFQGDGVGHWASTVMHRKCEDTKQPS